MFRLLFSNFLLLLFFGCSSSAQEESQNSKSVIRDINVSQFEAKTAEKDVVILDVRTPREIQKGKIANAVELDINDPNFEAEIEKLDKSKTYLVYCAAGSRSKKACMKMEKTGFEKLYNLKPGYKGWSKVQKQ